MPIERTYRKLLKLQRQKENRYSQISFVLKASHIFIIKITIHIGNLFYGIVWTEKCKQNCSKQIDFILDS